MRTLLRYLSAFGLLSACLATADIPTINNDSPSGHRLNLVCAECAFSLSKCSGNNHPNSFLTLEFSTQDDVLYANEHAIFPAPIPMHFDAVRYWESGKEAVVLTYAMEVLPLSRRTDDPIGDLYRLDIKLYDQHGRPATENGIIIGLVREANGDVKIFQAEENSSHHHHHHHNHHHSWASYLSSFFDKGQKKQHCVSGQSSRNGMSIGKCDDSYGQDRLVDWSDRDHSFIRFIRPVVLPGLLGLGAGVFACAVGFLVGRIVVSIYYFLYKPIRRPDVATSDGDADIELQEEVVPASSEKEKLILAYGELTTPNYPSR